MILLLDNYDSFAHNLARYFRQLGQQVKVIRNDEWTVDQVADFNPQAIVISPGPCTPNEAGICLEVVERMSETVPIFGVCLGHQVICQAFGGTIATTKPMHGQASQLTHRQASIFAGLASPMRVGRYHSLIADQQAVPNTLKTIATTFVADESEIVMAVEHEALPIIGVQFHPESILTEHGYRMLANFLKRCGISVDDSLVESLSQQLSEQVQPPPRRPTRQSQETVTPHGWSS